jgi:hypothetical protein
MADLAFGGKQRNAVSLLCQYQQLFNHHPEKTNSLTNIPGTQRTRYTTSITGVKKNHAVINKPFRRPTLAGIIRINSVPNKPDKSQPAKWEMRASETYNFQTVS